MPLEPRPGRARGGAGAGVPRVARSGRRREVEGGVRGERAGVRGGGRGRAVATGGAGAGVGRARRGGRGGRAAGPRSCRAGRALGPWWSLAPQRAGRCARRAGAGPEAAAAPCAGEEPGAGGRPAGGGWGPRRGVPERRRRKRQRRLSRLGAWVRGGSGSARGASGRPGCLPPRLPPPRLGGRWRWADGNPNDGLQTRLHLYHGRCGGRATRFPALAARGA